MTADRRNVVLVSIDSLRADHCGHLGDDRGLTPAMDKLAAEGVAFETAIAPGPQTFSSMPSVFTGQYRPPTSLEEYPQERHWQRRIAAVDEHLRRYATLPERLGECGYETAAVSPNPWTSAAAGFDRGFDQFVDVSGDSDDGALTDLLGRLPGLDADSRSLELLSTLLSGSEFFARWETLYEDLERVREELSEPYFLWVFLLDTHYPFLPARPHREEGSLLGSYYSTLRSSSAMRGNGGTVPDHVRAILRRNYRDTVRAVDAFIDRLRSDLAEDDPVTVIHADHGESLGEHGNYGHHHRHVYEENVNVPFVVHGTDATATPEDPVSLASIYDAVLDVTHDGEFDPAALTEPHVTAASECGTYRTVRGKRFKYVDHGGEQLLFNVETDPGETTDCSEEHPDLSRNLHHQLERLDRHFLEVDRVHEATREVVAAEPPLGD